MSDSFFQTEQVAKEMDDIQTTYTDLLKMSAGLKDFNPQQKLDHIEKTLELIAKQKVFYARLALASHEPGTQEEVSFVKDRVDKMSEIYSGGMNLMQILQMMEDKLQEWRRELKSTT